MTGGMSPEQTAQILKALKQQQAKQEREKKLKEQHGHAATPEAEHRDEL